MNRKTFRYLVPLVLLFGLIFTAVASADSSAPTVSTQVCIGFQGNRSNNEPVTWTVIQGTRSYTSSAGAAVVADGSNVGTFDVTGEPGASYTLEVKADDTLLYTFESPTPFPAANAGPCAIDLSSVRLQEGDANNDGNVATSDYNRWVARFRQPNECAGDAGYDNISTSADFNEDNCVTTFDYNLWVANFTPPPTSAVSSAPSSASSTRAAVNIGGDMANYDSTATTFDIVADLSGTDTYTSLQIQMTFDPSKVQIIGFTAGADFPQAGAQNIDNTNGNFTYVAGNPSGTSGADRDVVTVEFQVTDDSTPQTIEFVPGDTSGGQERGTLAYDNNFNPPEPFSNYQRIGIASSTAVSMSDLGITQQSFAIVALLAGALGAATLVVTRSARRQD